MTEPSVNPKALQVFNTVELLESILLHLPTKDVLLAQRVSKSWKGTVTGSLRLQKALFLVPCRKAAKTFFHEWLNPFWSTSTSAEEFYDNFAVTDVTTKGEIIVNPLLKPMLSLYTASGEGEFGTNHNITEDIFASQESSSWREMFVTQPPLLGIDVGIEIEEGEWDWSACSPEAESGVTLADLAKTLKDIVSNYESYDNDLCLMTIKKLGHRGKA